MNIPYLFVMSIGHVMVSIRPQVLINLESVNRGSNLDRQITLNQLSQPLVETLFLGSARSPLEWLCQKKLYM